MARQGITVDIDCRLTVSRETAETCLKLLETFINTHKGFGIRDTENEDGTVSFVLMDYNETSVSER